ncbi:uncharacterized protein LOC110076689 [Pogona vitticeps]
MVDRYENHGLIPEGRVCSSSAKRPRFPDFCTLTLYRCAMRKYFVKRILCPGETIEASTDTHTINQEAEPLHNLSFILQSLPKLLHSSSATATTPSPPDESPRSESPIEVVGAMSVSAMVIRAVSHDLTTNSPPPEPTSTALLASAESVLDLLFHTTTSIPELHPETPPETHPEIHPETHPEPTPEPHPELHPEPTPEPHPESHPETHPEATPEPHPETHPEPTPEPHPEIHPETHPEPTPETHPEPHPEIHPEQHTTPSAPELLVATSPATTTTEPVLDLLLESSLELLSPTAAKTDIETLLENLTATEAATVATETTTGSFLQLTTSPESVAEFSTSISNAETMSEVSIILDDSTTTNPDAATGAAATSGSISTHPARVAGKKKNSEEPYPATSSATTTESPSELPTHNTISAAPVRHEYDSTTCMNHLQQSPTAICHPHTSAPSATASLDLAKHPPQSNSSMGIVVVSTFIHHKPEGTLGLIPLLRIGMRSPNPQHEQESPGLQQLPPHDLKRLFLRMQDHRVQHLMHEMRDLMTKGEIVQKQKLQATSLQLLRALNLPNQQRRLKRSMRLKR